LIKKQTTPVILLTYWLPPYLVSGEESDRRDSNPIFFNAVLSKFD
jgi:hypothetical protein